MKIAWLFPGQGSQKLGMNKDVLSLNNAQMRFNYASQIFSKDLLKICEEKAQDNDANNDLNNTLNTQICLFLVEAILLDSLKEKNYKPDFVAGHSLGEISALYAAEVLTFEDCVSLIKIRSELMSKAPKGVMAALIGFNRDELNNAINNINDVVIANDNSASQVVVSGKKESLQILQNQIKCKRFLYLNVSGAFHSHLMKEPSIKFSEYLDTLNFSTPIFPIISNYKPRLSNNADEIKNSLKEQMCNGVRWRETMDLIASEDSNIHVVEIGPSNVLSGLAKRHLKDLKISQINSSENLSY